VVLWVVARLTGMLQFYNIPTPANEPNLKIGEKFFTTNLKEPKPYQFIAFTSVAEDSIISRGMENFKFGSHYLYRLCGVSGNTLEMKNAVLYVDGKNFDEDLSLKYEFEISKKSFEDIIEEADKTDGSYKPFYPPEDSMLIDLDRTQIKKYQSLLKLTPFISRDTANGPFKWLDKNTTWTVDNFGPLTIPQGYYFGLGDNRHNALDSRFTGFIKAADIKGVVLGK